MRRHEFRPNHGPRKLFHTVCRIGGLDAASLAPSSGMYLGLDDRRATQIGGDPQGLFNGEGHSASGDINPELFQNLLGLIFVDLNSFLPL